MEETKDYVPFMDRYPELKLRPVTEFPDHVKVHGKPPLYRMVL